eukprot:scaffold260375_cov27-Tisochrysis_lutea.AAC.2
MGVACTEPHAGRVYREVHDELNDKGWTSGVSGALPGSGRGVRPRRGGLQPRRANHDHGVIRPRRARCVGKRKKSSTTTAGRVRRVVCCQERALGLRLLLQQRGDRRQSVRPRRGGARPRRANRDRGVIHPQRHRPFAGWQTAEAQLGIESTRRARPILRRPPIREEGVVRGGFATSKLPHRTEHGLAQHHTRVLADKACGRRFGGTRIKRLPKPERPNLPGCGVEPVTADGCSGCGIGAEEVAALRWQAVVGARFSEIAGSLLEKVSELWVDDALYAQHPQGCLADLCLESVISHSGGIGPIDKTGESAVSTSWDVCRGYRALDMISHMLKLEERGHLLKTEAFFGSRALFPWCNGRWRSCGTHVLEFEQQAAPMQLIVHTKIAPDGQWSEGRRVGPEWAG